MIRTTQRKARKIRKCDRCGQRITPGDLYLEHVASPDHGDLCNPHWWRLPECADCAICHGRMSVTNAETFDA